MRMVGIYCVAAGLLAIGITVGVTAIYEKRRQTAQRTSEEEEIVAFVQQPNGSISAQVVTNPAPPVIRAVAVTTTATSDAGPEGTDLVEENARLRAAIEQLERQVRELRYEETVTERRTLPSYKSRSMRSSGSREPVSLMLNI